MTHEEFKPWYQSFIEKADEKAEYVLLMTGPSEKAEAAIYAQRKELSKVLKEKKALFSGEDDMHLGEVLMGCYISGIDKAMKDKKHNYYCFSKVNEIGGWDGLETPKVHISENIVDGRVFDLKKFIENSHKNEVYQNKDNFNDIYIEFANVLHKADVSPLVVTAEWLTSGKTLRNVSKFLTQTFRQLRCHCGDTD